MPSSAWCWHDYVRLGPPASSCRWCINNIKIGSRGPEYTSIPLLSQSTLLSRFSRRVHFYPASLTEYTSILLLSQSLTVVAVTQDRLPLQNLILMRNHCEGFVYLMTTIRQKCINTWPSGGCSLSSSSCFQSGQYTSLSLLVWIKSYPVFLAALEATN